MSTQVQHWSKCTEPPLLFALSQNNRDVHKMLHRTLFTVIFLYDVMWRIHKQSPGFIIVVLERADIEYTVDGFSNLFRGLTLTSALMFLLCTSPATVCSF